MEIKVNDKNFKQEVLKSDISVLVDFWAPWCGPCQMVAPIVEAIAEKYKGKLKVCKINVDEAPNTSSEYGIMSIPTLAIFKKDAGFQKFSYYQTLYNLPAEIKSVQKPRKGFGQGGFVVISGKK